MCIASYSLYIRWGGKKKENKIGGGLIPIFYL